MVRDGKISDMLLFRAGKRIWDKLRTFLKIMDSQNLERIEDFQISLR